MIRWKLAAHGALTRNIWQHCYEWQHRWDFTGTIVSAGDVRCYSDAIAESSLLSQSCIIITGVSSGWGRLQNPDTGP
jgi:hypothetical protein